MSFIAGCKCTATIIAFAAISIQAGFAEDLDNRARRLARLEAGVRAEEAIRAVKRLQHTYGHYRSLGLWNDLTDLFTENATGHFPTGTVKGKINLRKYFMQQAERTLPGLAQGQLNTYLLLQPIITLGPDGKTAKGAWHEMALLGKFGSTAAWLGGIYENEYAIEKGTWKISRVRYFQQYGGSYAEWGHKAPPKWDIPYHFDAAHVGVTIPQSALQLSSSSKVPATVPITQLSRRVRQLSDETQVQNLQHSYGYYLDRKMWDDIADLFTEDGTLEVAQRGEYKGKSRIRRALEAFYGPFPLRKGELFDHINLATVVTVAPDGRSSGARTSQLSMLGLNWEYAQWEIGTYENEFVKEDGAWKIKAIRYYPRMTSDYDKGWAVDAKPAPGESQDFPPDRPSMPACTSYPGICYVAFHYVNPGTGRPVRYPTGTVVQAQAVKQPANPAREAAVVPDNANLDLIVAALENRLDAAIAVDAVENLNSSYGYYIDESAWDNMADTFASSGSKEITGVGVYVGPERIRKVLNLRGPRGGRTPDFFTIHQLTQPVIHISADRISANARLRLFQCGGNADGSSGSWIGGIYENTAVKENGEWKFGAQDLHHIFNASYRNGWARIGRPPRQDSQMGRPLTGREVPGGGIQQGLGGAALPNRFAREFPPDRPIRSKQYAFPEIVEPAFHYRNPVTGRIPPELLK
jgi:hypothetical protein